PHLHIQLVLRAQDCRRNTFTIHLGHERAFAAAESHDLTTSVHRPDEAIAVTWQCFDEMRALGVVIQRRPQPLHSVVEALLEVHKSVGWPELLLQFFPGDRLARVLEEHDENPHWLALQPNLHAFFAEFPSSWIELEYTKTEGWRNCTGTLHTHSQAAQSVTHLRRTRRRLDFPDTPSR